MHLLKVGLINLLLITQPRLTKLEFIITD